MHIKKKIYLSHTLLHILHAFIFDDCLCYDPSEKQVKAHSKHNLLQLILFRANSARLLLG